ncbi:MAG: hypothetical protein ACFE0Q_03810 [Anaerolineae bacterium]
MQADIYQQFTEQLIANLEADDRVKGLVLLGSTANQSHPPDQWSDHDFFVITDSGVQELFRTRFDWLPNSESIVLTVRETAHGLKVLYEDGHLLEYAVFDMTEISLAKANDYVIAFDRGEITTAMQKIVVQSSTMTYSADQQARDAGLFLCLLVVGAGRVVRGEQISGQVFVRAYALSHLLRILIHMQGISDKSSLDNLDIYRRFEHVFPQLGDEINAVLAGDTISVALGLLDIYERALPHKENSPTDAINTVRHFLLRITT